MKLLLSHDPVYGNSTLPKFIFGLDGVGGGIERYVVIHTCFPRFTCRMELYDGVCDWSENEPGVLLSDSEQGGCIYLSREGLRLFDFGLMDNVIALQLLPVCHDLVRVYCSEDEMSEPPMVSRQLKPVPEYVLSNNLRHEQVGELVELARQAAFPAGDVGALSAMLKKTLACGDSSVFTEAQLALLGEPEARSWLVSLARDIIAFPASQGHEFERGMELWALPFAFSRAEGGLWWHFPELQKMEAPLKRALGLDSDVVLQVSPTLFALDMLHHSFCHDLVHLVSYRQMGYDVALDDPVAARARYEFQSTLKAPQLVVAWIPFWLPRGMISTDSVQQHSRELLDIVMPLVLSAVRQDMPYGEAELFAPLPWWESLSSGVRTYNRKRLGMTIALVAAATGGAGELEAVAEFQPGTFEYEVGIRVAGRDIIAKSPWWLTPDVVPNKQEAWLELSEYLEESGIPLSEIEVRLH